MKLILASAFTLLICVTIFAKSEAKNKGCNCPQENIPVCGEDGDSYRNLCAMKCQGIKKAREGECRKQLKNCQCPDDFSPVCGKKSSRCYSNECELRCQEGEKGKS